MCNENLDLVKLLGDCPKGTKLWSPLLGEITFERVEREVSKPIICSKNSVSGDFRFTRTGRYCEGITDAECILFPSKDNRDWSTFVFTMYKDGDFLANNDGRAFIFRGKFNNNGYPMAYGGVDTTDRFIKSRDMAAWSSAPFRKATPEEVSCMMNKMKEAGYVWNANEKKLKRDLPIDTLVAACDNFKSETYFSSMVIRRYAGEHKCFNNNGGSKTHDRLTTWRHIIPLTELTVDEEGVVEFDKVNDYGTCNYNV